MTNEEAINLIGQLRMYISGGGVIDRHLDEAVQMAIDALKELGNQSQEINNPNDCISRQVAIDICHKNYDGILDFRSDGWTVESSFEDIINSVPSAQPEIVPCGDCKHWICHDRRCGYWNHGVKPLEWCCHAERKENR